MIRQPAPTLIFFVLQAALNWFYVLWVKYQFSTLVNAWFALVPLIGFFYVTFCLIACYGLYQQKQFGLSLAFGVLVMGVISVAISFMLVFNRHPLIDAMIVPLFVVNLCIGIYMGVNREYFRGD
jgi:hypothetical protein